MLAISFLPVSPSSYLLPFPSLVLDARCRSGYIYSFSFLHFPAEHPVLKKLSYRCVFLFVIYAVVRARELAGGQAVGDDR